MPSSKPYSNDLLNQLTSSLMHGSWSKQASAFMMLKGMGVQAIPAFITALSHKKVSYRIKAAKVLGGLGPAANSAIPALRDLARSNPIDVSTFIVPNVFPV